MAARWFDVPCVVLEPGVRSGMPILYDNPKEVGADRIANAVGAYDLYGAPASSSTWVPRPRSTPSRSNGEYLGGAIAPGIAISLDALFHHAAALRRVELVEPRSVIGKSTVESIQSGALYGFAAQVDGMCRPLLAELGPPPWSRPAACREIIAPLSQSIEHHEPWLTLHGLRLVYERNVQVRVRCRRAGRVRPGSVAPDGRDSLPVRPHGEAGVAPRALRRRARARRGDARTLSPSPAG